MHSYQTLAVLALAVSTASPALSAPVLEQPRASVTGILGGDIVKEVVNGLKQLGTGGLLGAAPAVAEHFLGGNSTRRALPRDTDTIPDRRRVDLNDRSISGSLFDDVVKALGGSGSVAKVITNGLLGGLGGGVAAAGATSLLNNTRREPLSIPSGTVTGLEKAALGTLASFATAHGIEGIFGSNSTRRDQAPSSSGGDDETVTVSDLLKALKGLRRRLEELD